MHQKCFLILLLALNLIIGACAHSSQTAPNQVPLKEIRSGQQMAGASKLPGCMWITNKKQLSEMMVRVAGKTRISTRPVELPEIDFSTHGVLVVWMGQKSTGGYALGLMARTATVKNKTVLVPVSWIEPQQGMLTTQVITHPYLMIQMAKGNYTSIAVIDQNGLARTKVNVREK